MGSGDRAMRDLGLEPKKKKKKKKWKEPKKNAMPKMPTGAKFKASEVKAKTRRKIRAKARRAALQAEFGHGKKNEIVQEMLTQVSGIPVAATAPRHRVWSVKQARENKAKAVYKEENADKVLSKVDGIARKALKMHARDPFKEKAAKAAKAKEVKLKKQHVVHKPKHPKGVVKPWQPPVATDEENVKTGLLA